MHVSQKCQYAVRAMLELSKRHGRGPAPISEIASRQAIPPRFLEIILNEIKQGGFVDSRRGVQGGYLLLRDPKDITVGEIVRFVDGPFDPVRCGMGAPDNPCPLRERCSLIGLWQKAKAALESVYDATTFQDLADQELTMERQLSHDFNI